MWYSDYINPIDLCNRLNTYMIPEAAVHGFLTIMFLINGYWVALILNLPLAAFNAKKYVFSLEIARKRRTGYPVMAHAFNHWDSAFHSCRRHMGDGITPLTT